LQIFHFIYLENTKEKAEYKIRWAAADYIAAEVLLLFYTQRYFL